MKPQRLWIQIETAILIHVKTKSSNPNEHHGKLDEI